MKKKKLFDEKALESLSAEEIIKKIKYENYSLLDSLGAEDLRREMVKVGKICNIAVNYFFKTTGPKDDPVKHNAEARKKLVKKLSKIAPGDYAGMPKDSKNGMVVGFNHPSLGEIVRILSMKIDIMGDKPMYFPVNLPWYEALAPNSDKIERLGIILTPTITPSTWEKMKLQEDSKIYEIASRIKRDFRDTYTELSDRAIKEGGVIFLAPSATRQATVFKDEAVYDKKEEIIPTMSILAIRLYKDPKANCDFWPLAVLPPEGYGRGLNFFKKYKLIPGEVMTAAEIRKKYFKAKNPKRLEGFDWEFHKRIADELPKKFWY